MTQEDKELLLKELSARLPYNVKCYCKDGDVDVDIQSIWKAQQITECTCCVITSDLCDFETDFYNLIPYLRPMSSITDEEKEYLNKIIYNKESIFSSPVPVWVINECDIEELIDFYNKNQLDWRGLIKKGLAIEKQKTTEKTED